LIEKEEEKKKIKRYKYFFNFNVPFWVQFFLSGLFGSSCHLSLGLVESRRPVFSSSKVVSFHCIINLSFFRFSQKKERRKKKRRKKEKKEKKKKRKLSCATLPLFETATSWSCKKQNKKKNKTTRET